MQRDGNFVVYLQGTPIWASGSMMKNPDHFAIMQDDGDFVLYNGDPDKSAGAYCRQIHSTEISG